MGAALKLRSARVALVVAALAGLAMLPSPLLGVHRVESALLLGVLLPPFVAPMGARWVLALRRRGVGASAATVIGRAVGAALVVWAVPTVLLALGALHVPQCTPLEGLAFMALGPGVGVVLAALVGVTAAAWVRRPPIATAIAVAVPLAAIAVGLWRFWSTPAIFVFQHFAGWFPGTIYDEDVGLPESFVTFRLVTVALAVGLAALVSAGWSPATALARPRRLLRAPWRAALAVLLLAGAAVAHAKGEQLGHRTSDAYIAEELGRTERGERCIVHTPREMDTGLLKRLVDDCDFRVWEAERVLGVEQRAPVEAFLFRSAGEKRRLMGAGDTNIAKPWRDQVYLQRRGWPHPVLAHEVAHVVAARAARGPFRVSGVAGGWLPNPGLIEGAAVAIAWNEREGLTPHQWAKAMVQLGEMPPLSRIVGLEFMLHSASHAYTAAGSFVRFLHESEGPGLVRRAYRSGDVAEAAGKPLSELEAQWHAFLQQEVSLPDDALALARQRFSGKSIFASVCPHEVAKLRDELGGDVSAGDYGAASGTCRRILGIDPSKLGVHATLVGALARTGDVDAARAELEALRGLDPPPPVLVAAREKLADALWAQGRQDEALAIYRGLLDLPQRRDAARGLEVKALALERGGREAELVRRLLVPDGEGPSGALAVHIGGQLSALRDDGLGPYLAARQLLRRHHYDLALPLLREAERRTLATERLRRENARLVGVSLYATGRYDEAERHWRAIADDETARAGRRTHAEDWLARLRFTRD